MSEKSILVVDDAPVNLKLMRLLLTHEGYPVRTAESAEEALQLLSDYRPDLILADIQLPGMGGLDMTRLIKANPQTRSLRVVALTACAMKEDRQKALEAGCEDFITKPIDTAALSSKVRELLANAPEPTADSSAEPENENVTAGFGAELETLRTRFLDEGASRSRQFLETLNSGFDAALAARLLHEWAGSAGLVGYTDISSLARKGEALLRQPLLNLSDLRVVFTDLLLAFSGIRDSLAKPLPPFVVEACTGKRIALIGLTAKQADAMCESLERVKARPRLFEPSDDPHSEAIRDCDLVIFHVAPHTRQSAWLQTGSPAPAVKRLIYTGTQDDLIALSADVRARATDFLAGNLDPEDVVLRLAFAFSRSQADLPAVPATVADSKSLSPGSTPSQPKPKAGRPKIVFADDDDIVRSLVSSALQNFGMNCHGAHNGAEALEMIRTEAPQVAVLDVNMPGMSGYEVLSAIRAEKISTRVIMLTSLQSEKDVLQAFNLGADDYVTKPFNPFEVVARLKRLLQW